MTGSFSHFTAIPLTALSKEMGEGQSLNSEYDKISPMNDNWSLFHVNYSGCIREIDKLETEWAKIAVVLCNISPADNP